MGCFEVCRGPMAIELSSNAFSEDAVAKKYPVTHARAGGSTMFKWVLACNEQ